MTLRKIKKTNCNCLKQLVTLMMAVIMILSLKNSVNADEQNNGKEEVVYGILNTEGMVNGIYLVNIFDHKGSITDYGNYSSVRNMTSNDNITLDDGVDL